MVRPEAGIAERHTMRRLAIVLLALVTTIGTVPVLAMEEQDPEIETWETTVESFDDHEVPVKVYNASGTGSAPTLLWGHGWSGSYADSDGDGEFFAQEGYNVVAMDFRGHGQARADTYAYVHSPDKEIRDVRHVIDWIANRSWAETETGTDIDRDTPDPVLGALGGSYGGGYQLLTAAFDDRLDAIAPEITWNDLPQSLAPNGAIKSTWVDVLYAAGTAAANPAPFIHEGYAWGTATNEFPDGEGPIPGEPNVEDNFTASSPTSYPGAIDVPALLIQGMGDLLFPLNQAVDNARQIEDAGSPEVNLVTHLSGHVLNTNGTLGGADFGVGIQDPDRGSPCGDTDELVLAWYDEHLKGQGDDGIPRAKIAFDDGSCHAGASVAEAVLDEKNSLESSLADVLLPQGAPVASGHVQAEEHVRLPSPVRRTVLDASETATVAGAGTLTGDITITGEEAIVYVSLLTASGGDERVVHDQVMPLRVDGERDSFTLDLAGVGVQVDDGETLAVEFSTAHPVYGDNGNRQAGTVALENLELSLPTVS